ncbi:MAG: dTDP-4-dehydrorhamnose 3,5-epimerase [Candidatus Moranbacteria bacterium]|nr:dTDP-4-dehydrorhamnose 3,5-epimerase [Candidatus Moranbacteria bacterium]
MNIEETPLEGLKIITPSIFGDERGFFMEAFHQERYRKEVGIEIPFVQDNLSQSLRGVLRGLHFQKKPHRQGKLVSVLFGSAWDVAVDIRPYSKTFGKWYAVELSGENHKQFWIPPGFAHGFVTLKDHTLFSYKCSDFYTPDCEGGLLWDDEDIAIDWPMKKEEIILSQKDAHNISFKQYQSL